MNRSINSPVEFISCPAEKVFGFLADFNNFSSFLPEQVANFEATADSCSFEVKGLATLGLRITEKIPVSKITMTGEGKIPFAFNIETGIVSLGTGNCSVQMTVNSDMNPMIAMMAEKPLANFVGALVAKLKAVMESSQA